MSSDAGAGPAWADEVHVELLVAWGAADDGPLPTRDDAVRVARERAALLREGLGEWAEVPGKVLDRNQRVRTRSPRGWRRNAWAKDRPGDGPWWWRVFGFGDDEV